MNCGSEIKEENEKFCEFCGTRLSNSEKKPIALVPHDKTEEIKHLEDEVFTLRQETNRLRNQSQRRAQWRQNQQSCCGCLITLIILGVIISLLFNTFLWDFLLF